MPVSPGCTRCRRPRGGAKYANGFLHGALSGPEDLERIRVEIESFDNIDVIDDEIRRYRARNWPYLRRNFRRRRLTGKDAVGIADASVVRGR